MIEMRDGKPFLIDHRDVLQILGLGAGALAASGALPSARVLAQSRGDTLVIGMDISDTPQGGFDPVQTLTLTPPMTMQACYDTLLTQNPGDYVTLLPRLATRWERTPSGNGWRFHLRPNVKFVSGNPVTADDVKFSLDRVLHYGQQAATYAAAITRVEVVDDMTVDIIMDHPWSPFSPFSLRPATWSPTGRWWRRMAASPPPTRRTRTRPPPG